LDGGCGTPGYRRPMSDTREAVEPDHAIGHCHCGAVRFRVRLEHRSVVECNCSICQMKGHLHYIVREEDVEVLAGEDDLRSYTFNTHTAKHYFCPTCGISPIYRPRSHPEGFSVNFRCLDLDATARESFAPETFDGANWEDAIEALHAGDPSEG
jgi:hypothetical protein